LELKAIHVEVIDVEVIDVEGTGKRSVGQTVVFEPSGFLNATKAA
jgi:hypothetical protein